MYRTIARMAGIAALLALSVPLAAHAATYQVLHNFAGAPQDGSAPWGGFAGDADGNLYGTTQYGGKADMGTVFRIAADGSYKLLASFKGKNGAYPMAGLILGRDGNLYGTTSGGGKPKQGTVFKVSPSGKIKVIYAFKGRSDGSSPAARLYADAAGDLYGTALSAGDDGHGTVFEITAGGTFKVLASFGACTYCGTPLAGVTMDASGNIWGTTFFDGAYECDFTPCGTVFKITPDGTYSWAHSFNGSDGANPRSDLTIDAQGNLYGTTSSGGTHICGQYTCGTAFEIAADGTFSTLHSFQGNDGESPLAGMTFDASGDLLGTTGSGGSIGAGTVYEIKSGGGEKVLQSLSGAIGEIPRAPLWADGGGNFYGTASQGGSFGDGVAFKLTP